MEYYFLYSLIFAGIIQGIFLSSVILFSKENKSTASTHLGILILSVALSNLQTILEEIGLISLYEFNLIYLPYLFLMPAALYFFITRFLYPEKVIKKVELLYYFPFVFFLSLTIVYKIISLFFEQTARTDSIQLAIARCIDFYGDFITIFIVLLTLIYLYFITNNYSNTINKSNPNYLKSEVLWIKIFLGIMFIILFPWLYYTYQYLQNPDVFYVPILVIASFVIYVWGYIGIHQIKVLEQRKKIKNFLHKNRNYSIVEKQKNEHIIQLEKIILDDEKYLDPNLTLDIVADELQLSKGHLSRIINTELEMGFTDYINNLRVIEAKKSLLHPDFSDYTIVAIGLESGFSSKSTFNAAFKKFTNQTPSQFRKKPLN